MKQYFHFGIYFNPSLVLVALMICVFACLGCVDDSFISDGTAYEHQHDAENEPTDTSEAENNDVPDGDEDEAIEDPVDAPSIDCNVQLHLSEGIIMAETSEERVQSGTQPWICWHVGDSEAPLEQGWHVQVEREETAGSGHTEWLVADGIPSHVRHLRYGECPEQSLQCSEAAFLHPGRYFVYIWDAQNPSGLGAATVFEVD